jgi:hypothetical protein
MITTQAEQRGRRCEDPQDTKLAHGVQDLHVQCICAVQLHPTSTFPPHTLPHSLPNPPLHFRSCLYISTYFVSFGYLQINDMLFMKHLNVPGDTTYKSCLSSAQRDLEFLSIDTTPNAEGAQSLLGGARRK